jgi:hypothetical protein
MSDVYTTPIKSAADAEGFFFQLHQLGLLFHPEDNPSEVVNKNGPIFTPDQAKHLNDRLDEVYEVMLDPCAYCLTLTSPDSDRDEDYGLSYDDRAQFYGPSTRI